MKSIPTRLYSEGGCFRKGEEVGSSLCSCLVPSDAVLQGAVDMSALCPRVSAHDVLSSDAGQKHSQWRAPEGILESRCSCEGD